MVNNICLYIGHCNYDVYKHCERLTIMNRFLFTVMAIRGMQVDDFYLKK